MSIAIKRYTTDPKMSLNMVRKGPEAAAGSNFNLYRIMGSTTPINEVAIVAETIDRKIISANFITSGSFALIIAPIIAAPIPHIIPI
jgi:hypothetical protein